MSDAGAGRVLSAAQRPVAASSTANRIEQKRIRLFKISSSYPLAFIVIQY